MSRRHRRDYADVGIGDLGEALNLHPADCLAELPQPPSVLLAQNAKASVAVHQIVEISFRFKNFAAPRLPPAKASWRIAATISLVVVLPLEPVIASTFGANCLPAIVGQIAQGRERVSDFDRGPRPNADLGNERMRDDAAGATRDRVADKAMTVMALAFQRNKKLSRF